MAKRRLTRQQSRRIRSRQSERAARAEAADAAAVSEAGEDLGPERPGRLIAHFGAQVLVEDASGAQHRCHLRANLDPLVVGDRVVFCAPPRGAEGEPDGAIGVVVARQPRDSELLRPDSFGNIRPVAANVDQILIVIAPAPAPHANLLDRYLVAAECTGAEPLLVLNKSDRLTPTEAEAMEALLQPYRALGYRILRCSCVDGSGIDALTAALTGRTSVFVGQSGVGKTSLVNRLLPEANEEIGALSASKGTHTTTTARLFHLPTGGDLIDSPGIREFGLWHMSPEDIAHGFREFRSRLGHCRFRNCEHQSEPGCAILEAVDAGDIAAARLNSYRHIIGSLQT